MLAEEATAKLFKNKGAGYSETVKSAAQILLDSADAVADTEGLYFDCKYVGWKGNVKFFGDRNNPRNFERTTADIQKGLSALGYDQRPGQSSNMPSGITKGSSRDLPARLT